jgi:hypothetical protein
MPAPASAFNTFLPDTHTLMDKPKLLDRVHTGEAIYAQPAA